MTFPSWIKVSVPDFSWLRNQLQNARRDEEMLVEEDENDDVTSSPQQTTIKTKNDYVPQKFNKNFYIELVLLLLAFFLFSGMIVTALMLAMHDGRRSDSDEDLPEPFELKQSRISNLEICLTIYKISDERGACLVHTDKDFYGAAQMCSDHGMELLEIFDEDMKFKVFDETKQLFGSGGGTRLWINGRWSNAEKSWLVHPKNSSFYLTSDQVEHRSWGRVEQEGNCLAIESYIVDKYHIAACSCRGTHYFYCGF